MGQANYVLGFFMSRPGRCFWGINFYSELEKQTYAYYTKELAARRSSLYLRKMTLDPSCC